MRLTQIIYTRMRHLLPRPTLPLPSFPAFGDSSKWSAKDQTAFGYERFFMHSAKNRGGADDSAQRGNFVGRQRRSAIAKYIFIGKLFHKLLESSVRGKRFTAWSPFENEQYTIRIEKYKSIIIIPRRKFPCIYMYMNIICEPAK